MTEVIGSRLGRYEIRERLGRGGMATVYKGWDANLDRWVAVKVLHEHLTDDSDFRERFQREAKLSASLSHPNIVQTYDFDFLTRDQQTIYYMVMAFVDGPTLRSVLENHKADNKPLPLTEIQTVMEGVCRALTYAQSQGVTHRDVTPANIMFDKQGHVLLADFGLARMTNNTRYTQTGVTFGTPAYMSPEQGKGVNVDSRSDIYSLGVVLYEMLSGRTPYEGDSAYALVLKHVTDPIPELIPQLPVSKDMRDSLDNVIVHALAKEPEDRYQTAEDLLMDVQGAIAGETIQIKTPTRRNPTPYKADEDNATVMLPTARQPASPTVRLESQRPGVLLLLGAIAGVIIIVIILLLVRPGMLNAALALATPVQESIALLPTTTPGAVVSMVDSAADVSEDFTDPNSQNPGWLLGTTDPHITRAISHTKGLVITDKLASTAITTVIDPGKAAFSAPTQIQSTVTLLDNQQASATGLVFRFNDEANFYVFALDNLGRISLWWCDNGKWKELRHLAEKWTKVDGARPAGQPNTLRAVVSNERIQGFVNNIQVIDAKFDQPLELDDGGVGVYLATTTNQFEKDPLAEVDVHDYSVHLLTPVEASQDAVSTGPASMERF